MPIRFSRFLSLPFWLAVKLVATFPLGAVESRVYLDRFWQTSEGMPSNVVSDIAKDRDGFLWIATGAGVAKFDGLRFEVFTNADGLPDTQINCLHIDRQDRIWVGTRHGVAYREDGGWVVPHGLPTLPIFSLGEGADGSIWVGTYNGCWRWHAGKISRIEMEPVPADVRSFLSDAENGMWILTRSSLSYWKAETPDRAAEVTGPWLHKDLRDIALDTAGRLILCGAGVLLRRDGNGWEDLNPLIPDGDQNSNLACSVAPDNTLWVATRNRGLIYLKDSEAGGFVDASKGLSLDDVRCLMTDADGTIWAGTNGGGINHLRRRIFDVYSTGEGLGRTVPSALVVGGDGAVFAGTDGGGVFKKEDEGFVPHLRNMGLPADGLIWSMSTHPDGSLWVGTYQDGVFRVEDGRAEKIPFSPENFGKPISALCPTRDGGMLIGLISEGLYKWKDGRPDPAVPGLGRRVTVYDVLEDLRGDVWLATGSDGLWRLQNGAWQEVTRPIATPDLLPTVLHESRNGDLWIGSLGQGLIRRRDDRLARWNLADGLVSDTICQILEDDTGDLWLGSDRGLQRVSVSALEAYHSGDRKLPVEGLRFNRDDGLPTPQFSAEHGNLEARAPDGALWFSLASGAVRVTPSMVSKPVSVPVVRIESAFSDKKIIWSNKGRRSPPPIVVKPGGGTLQIRFASPRFVVPERARFQYRMVGLENEWQELEGSRIVSYASLPPGRYQFQIAGPSSAGSWSPLPSQVGVVVQPFLWQTLGFRVISGLVVLTGLGLLVRKWSIRRLHRRLAVVEQERRVEKERARIARDLHDELGASLTEINFLGTLTADSVSDPAVRHRVEGMVERAQRMAKSLDEIVWTVNPANDTLSSTVHYLCSRTQESLATANIRSRLEVAEHLPAVRLDSELRHHLLMAVNEAVHNVMKHSEATECILSIHTEGGILVVSVSDNGSGFVPPDAPGDRNGLVNLQRRMDATDGSVHIDSNARGTVVTLRLPLP